MKNDEDILYYQIERSINAMKENVIGPICLTTIAEKLDLSPKNLQKLFSKWAGINPQKFLQNISAEHTKNTLKGMTQPNLFNVADGLRKKSLDNCLPSSFISIQRMDISEYKNEGKSLTIQYDFRRSLFGKVIIATTHKGICYMAFYNKEDVAFEYLKSKFPKATFEKETNTLQQNGLAIFEKEYYQLPEMKLHLKGTDFQLIVWQSLLSIKFGELTSYGTLAKKINNPNASRAVGTAIGANPVAFIIPCHRIVQFNGSVGEYMWGATRKTAIIGWEACKISKF